MSLMSDHIYPEPVPVSPPASEAELIHRCQQIAGKTVGQLAQQSGLTVPVDLRRHKGWLGNLLERILGAGGLLAGWGPDLRAESPRLLELGGGCASAPAEAG